MARLASAAVRAAQRVPALLPQRQGPYLAAAAVAGRRWRVGKRPALLAVQALRVEWLRVLSRDRNFRRLPCSSFVTAPPFRATSCIRISRTRLFIPVVTLVDDWPNTRFMSFNQHTTPLRTQPAQWDWWKTSSIKYSWAHRHYTNMASSSTWGAKRCASRAINASAKARTTDSPSGYTAEDRAWRQQPQRRAAQAPSE